MRHIFDLSVHVIVYLNGRCKVCHAYNEKMIHDYGKKKYGDLEKELDHTVHHIPPLICKKCGTEFAAEYLEYKEKLTGKTITKTRLDWGNMIDEEEYRKMDEGHKRRYEIFKENEKEFWEKYENYALEDFRKAIGELQKFEFEEAYRNLQINNVFKTVNQYHKDVINRFVSPKDKRRFWREANRFFIYDHILEIGPLGWQPELDLKDYGQNRVRFVILNFPLDESLEGKRTYYIGQVIKKEKGDNDFLFRRIHQLTNELQSIQKRNTDYFHKIETLKHEIAKYQQKLNIAYQEIENLKKDKQVVYRDPSDIAKINELKSFVSELITELKEKEMIIKKQSNSETNQVEPIELDEENENEQQFVNYENLLGKTLAIIGGQRDKHATQNYVCNVITHSGQTSDPAFQQTLKQADILVVLTRYISHEAMWETKAYAINEGKPIFFMNAININRIIEEVAKKLI